MLNATNPQSNGTNPQSNGTNPQSNGLRFIPEIPKILTKDEVKSLVDQASKRYKSKQHIYVKALPLRDKAEQLYLKYYDDARQEEERLYSKGINNDKELKEIEKRRSELQDKLKDAERKKAEAQAKISEEKDKKAPKVKDFDTLIASKNLGEVEPTLPSLMARIREKIGAEDMLSLRSRRKALIDQLSGGAKVQPTLATNPIFTTKKHWKEYIPLVLLSLLPGSLTGFAIGSAVGFIRHSQLARFRLDAGAILAILFGVILVSVLGGCAEKLTQMAYDDKRRTGRISREVMVYVGLFLLVLAVEVIGDAIGLRILFLRMQMIFPMKIPSFLAYPLAFLIAVPVIGIKVISTSAALRAQIPLEGEPVNTEEVLKSKLALLESEIERAEKKEKEVDEYIDKWPTFGEISEVLSDIKLINSKIEEIEEDISLLDEEAEEINDEIDKQNTLHKAREAEILVNRDTLRQFKSLADEIEDTQQKILQTLDMT